MIEPRHALAFDVLPNELLREIRGYIDDDDLPALVCWYLLSPRFQLFLNDLEHLDDKYWQLLCWSNGLGCYDEDERDGAWLSTALECVKHAWHCTHPECGRARLRSNVSYMRDFRSRYPAFVLPGADGDQCPVNPFNEHFSPVFSHIAFGDKCKRGIGDVTISYLRSPTEDIRQIANNDQVHRHEVIMRSFAMFPPCALMRYSNLDVPDARNKRGVTVGNVVDAIMTSIAAPLTVEGARDVLLGLDPSETVFPRGWSLLQTFASLTDHGGLFRVLHWVGFRIIWIDEDGGLRCHFEFKPRALPEAKDELHDGTINDSSDEEDI